MADVKVLIGEKDGVEYVGATEYVLLADDVPYDNTDSTLDSTNVNDAIDELDNEKTSIIARAFRGFTSNGVVSDNEWFGRTELIPSNTTPLRIPWTSCTLTELTFENSNTGVVGAINLFKNGILEETLMVDTGADTGVVFELNIPLVKNDKISAQWDGLIVANQNPSDASIDFDFILDS